MIGAAALVEIRRRGYKPAGLVFLNIASTESAGCRDWHRWANTQENPELWIKTGTPPQRLDLVCLVGLPVIVVAETWTAWLASLWEAIKAAMPSSATLAVADFEDDIGFVWTPDAGQRLVGEPPIAVRAA